MEWQQILSLSEANEVNKCQSRFSGLSGQAVESQGSDGISTEYNDCTPAQGQGSGLGLVGKESDSVTKASVVNGSQCQLVSVPHTQQTLSLSPLKGELGCVLIERSSTGWLSSWPLCYMLVVFFSEGIYLFWCPDVWVFVEDQPIITLGYWTAHTFQIFPMMLSAPLSAFVLLLLAAIRQAPFEVAYWFFWVQSNIIQSSFHYVYSFIPFVFVICC